MKLNMFTNCKKRFRCVEGVHLFNNPVSFALPWKFASLGTQHHKT